MPLIKPKTVVEYIARKISIPKTLSEEVERYCEWAEIQEVDHFFSEAAKEVLKRDKEYIKQTKCTTA